MSDKLFVSRLAACLLLLGPAVTSSARQAQTAPAPGPAREREGQDLIKIYSQEVHLPVVAYDDRERFDPTLAADDMLVLEDGVPQPVRSVRRVPASVLLVLDLGGQTAALRSATAREAALTLIKTLPDGDRLAIIQNSGPVELLQDWTTDTEGAARRLLTKFFSGRRSRLSECLALAGATLGGQPVGSTHVVIFTDGLEAQTRDEIRSEPIRGEALKNLIATQASVHVFGFAALVNDFVKERNSPVSVGGSGNAVKVVIDTDMEMRRWFRNYGRATAQRGEELAALAEKTGGRLLLPSSAGEFVNLAEKVSKDIGAQYVVTYKPQRPLGGAGGERRRVDVHSRRLGLQLFSLRRYITTSAT